MLTHSFLGVFVARQVATDLVRIQGALRETRDFEAIPRRMLHLTLDDLGPVPTESLEAATLACERVVAEHGPLTVRSRDLVQLGPIVALTFDDPKERLRSLRAALHAGLADYGFALDARRFTPHIALGRGPLPAVPPLAPSLSLRVDRISLLRHAAPDEPGPPWRLRWERELSGPAALAAPAPDSATRDDEIRALLEARLDSRAARRAAVERAQASPAASPPTADNPKPRSRRRRRRGGRSSTPRKSS